MFLRYMCLTWIILKTQLKPVEQNQTQTTLTEERKCHKGVFGGRLVAGKSRGFLVSHVISLRLGFLLCKMGPVLMQSPES